jgi:hypothetical protein
MPGKTKVKTQADCEGPYMARRLQRLAHILRSSYFKEAAEYVTHAAIAICETLPERHSGKGSCCHCIAWRKTQRIPLPNCKGNSRHRSGT